MHLKTPQSGTSFQNTGLLPAAKLAAKYRPGRWNTGLLATLKAGLHWGQARLS